jgi:lysozyme
MDTKQLSAELKKDESVRYSAYKDSLGYLTIGVGRLIDARKGGALSDDEVEYLLLNDIVKVMAQLNAKLPWWSTLSEPRQRVLANMCFNLGIGGLLGFVNTLEFVRTGDYAAAAAGMLASKWATQVGARAQRLAAMMEAG